MSVQPQYRFPCRRRSHALHPRTLSPPLPGIARPARERDAAGTSGAELLALRVVCLGLVLCVVVLMPAGVLGPEAFAVPKEFVVHVVGFVAVQSCLSLSNVSRTDRIDRWLALVVLWSGLAFIAASNHWSAWRGLSLTGSGLAVFWSARVLAERGHRDLLISAVLCAGAVAAVTGMIEAYGIAGELSLPGRSPGGTLGHRNALAHLLTFSLPLMALAACASRSAYRWLFVGGCTLLVMPVVLSRSRGAWVAALVSILVMAAVLVAKRGLVDGTVRRRIIVQVVPAMLAGVAAAVALPTGLTWSSATPFRDTLGNIANYESGTGRGRLLQMAATIRMSADHPLVGVGPGNWRIDYPRYAREGDPSIRLTHPEPVNRLANTEWLSFAAERGLPAVLGLVMGALALAVGAWRGADDDHTPRAVLTLAALLGVVGAVVTVGLFDPVLAAPAALLFVATTLGALAPSRRAGGRPAGTPVRRLLVRVSTVAFGLTAVGCSGRQLYASEMYSTMVGAEQLTRALRWYPGDYRAHVLLAQAWIARDRCDLADPFLLRAQRLYPTATELGRMRSRCAVVRRGGRETLR